MHSSEEQSWHLNTTTSIVAPDWQDYNGCFQDKQNHHCMVAGVELEANAIDHEMSNQKQNNTSSLTLQKSGMLWKTGVLLYVLLLSFWGHILYFGPLVDHGSWQLFQSCHACATVFGQEIWPRTAWKHQSLAFCYLNFKQWHLRDWQE